MSGKLVCITCGTRTQGHFCNRCGEQHRFSDKLHWFDLTGPLANIDYLNALGFHTHFYSPDKLKDRIHPWNPPHQIPWFSLANEHLWYAADRWHIGVFKNGAILDVERNDELFTLLNSYHAKERNTTQ